jgi:hypothetical protein
MLRKLLVGLIAVLGFGVGPLTAGSAHAATHNFDGLCQSRGDITNRCLEMAIGPHLGHGNQPYVELNCRDAATPCKSWVIVADPFGLELKNFNKPYTLIDATNSCVNLTTGFGNSEFPFIAQMDNDCDGIDDNADLSLLPEGVFTYTVAGGDTGVPDDVAGVAMNLTVAGAKAAGFLTVFPCGQAIPKASNLNYNANGVIPNLVIASPGVNGAVCFYNSAGLDLLVDIAGFFPAGSGYVAQATPQRAVDTRGAAARVGGAAVQEVAVAGVFGVPADAAGVALNLTITGATSDGFATVFPCGQPKPTASNVNYVKGQDIPNFVIAKPGVGGKVCVSSSAPVDVILDVSGYFAAGTGFTATAAPVRFLDSRETTRIAAGTSKELVVAGDKGIPADAKAMAMNVTAVGPAADGFMTVYPCGEPVPVASSLNYTKGRDIANSVLAKPGVGGKVCFFSDKAVDIVVDVSGYFAASSVFLPIVPIRDLDTRERRTTPTLSSRVATSEGVRTENLGLQS